jgi:hypothetical protein
MVTANPPLPPFFKVGCFFEQKFASSVGIFQIAQKPSAQLGNELLHFLQQLTQSVTKRHGLDSKRPICSDSSFQGRGQIVTSFIHPAASEGAILVIARIDDFATVCCTTVDNLSTTEFFEGRYNLYSPILSYSGFLNSSEQPSFLPLLNPRQIPL